jgi:hypothetical protein
MPDCVGPGGITEEVEVVEIVVCDNEEEAVVAATVLVV